MSERANHLTAATIMLGKAQEALLHSYSPYSKFPVAAVVEDEHGTLFTGVNIENASFGLTICAERAAVFAAVSAGARGIRAVAISATKASPICPCGACRQVLAEFCLPDTPIYSDAGGGEYVTWKLEQLLPEMFKRSMLPGNSE